MNDDARKELTIFLGEKWHDFKIRLGETLCSCGHAGWWPEEEKDHRNRTFTTAQDMVDLARKMVEKGVWEGFMRYSDNMFIASMPRDTWEELFAWLITNPERFCQLCYDSEVWR